MRISETLTTNPKLITPLSTTMRHLWNLNLCTSNTYTQSTISATHTPLHTNITHQPTLITPNNASSIITNPLPYLLSTVTKHSVVNHKHNANALIRTHFPFNTFDIASTPSRMGSIEPPC